MADALVDSDGDTMSNRNEYIAGTDPVNAASYLKVDRIAANGPTTINSWPFRTAPIPWYSKTT
jgi:hypothetical protein